MTSSKQTRKNYLFITFILLLATILMIVAFPVKVLAYEKNTVLDELSSSPKFNIADYPEEPNNNSLNVIQIGESAEGNLYLYVYQPGYNAKKLKAISCSMALGYSVNGIFEPGSIKVYNLELVSSEGVFCKYLVKDYTVSKDVDRYYNIITIWREADSTIDGDVAGGKTEGISFTVGQQWYATNVNDSIVYEMNTFNTLELNFTYTGSAEFSHGLTLGSLGGLYERCDAWFVCFNVEDYIVEHIYDADITFKVREYSEISGPFTSEKNYKEWSSPIYKTLTDIDKFAFEGKGLFSKNVSWNRILSADEFIKTSEDQDVIWKNSDSAKENIEKSQWVFTFHETELSYMYDADVSSKFGSEVGSISILRLHFRDFSGKVYNLGVVSDLVSIDTVPDGIGSLGLELSGIKLIYIIIGIIVVLLLLPLIIYLLTQFPNLIVAIFKGIVWLFKIVISILISPYKLIVWIVGKIRDRK